MDTGLQELFDYCQIPESGQNILKNIIKSKL